MRSKWDATRPGIPNGFRDVVLGLHQHDGLRLHPVNAGIDGIGRLGGEIVFDFIGTELGAKISRDRAGTVWQNESWRSHSSSVGILDGPENENKRTASNSLLTDALFP